SRADIDQTGAEMALAVVMQRAAFLERNTDHLLLGCGRRLGDGLGHFARLAVSETDTPLAVTDHDERRKAEALATLHRLRDPVDVDQLLYQFLTAVIVAAATAAFVTTTPTATIATTATTAAAATAAATTSFARRTLLNRITGRLRLRFAGHGRLGARGRSGTGAVDYRSFLVVVFVSHHQNSSPPSRAASASALTRPWNR